MKELTKKLQEQFNKMINSGKLFRVKLSGSEIWDLYLKSFSKENDPIFRDPNSSVHNCNHCNNFIRRYGNIVSINEDYEIETIFDIESDDEYKDSMGAVSRTIKNSEVSEVFFETFNSLNKLPYESCSKNNSVFQLGVVKNVKRYTKEEAEKFGVVKPNEIRTFHHFNLSLPTEFVDKTGKSIEAIMGEYRSDKEVFMRTMEEISLDTLKLVRDLIIQGSLLNGDAHLHKIEAIIPLMEEYKNIPLEKRNNWCWVKSYKFQFAKFRNELIGVLCKELSEGEELNKACLNWNKRVDPANYMKAVAPITEAQKKMAQKFVEENGYEESFDRRFAVLDDIKVSEILHSNIGDGTIKKVSIFDNVKTSSSRHKRNEFKSVEEVSIEKFMKDILPGCTSVEAFLENKHEGNLVTLTTANNSDSKPIFKWDNNYSWTYKGNLAGKSMIKENVSKVGGNTEALVRVSLQWNDKDTPGIVDFDLHSFGENHIYYQNKGKTHSCGGHLDVDMINPPFIGIENITWKNWINDGNYVIKVKNYNNSSNRGFKVEIEFDNEVFNYHVNRDVRGFTDIAKLTVKNGQISIEHILQSSSSEKEIYGIKTQQFHKVKVACLSPNHWGNNKTGNKHYFFFLDKCKVDTPIRSFHTENLLPELAKHRKVLDVLGNTCMLEPNNNEQLSGLGFNATIRDEVILRLQGSHKRVIRVKF